jgi:hypothetical protein
MSLLNPGNIGKRDIEIVSISEGDTGSGGRVYIQCRFPRFSGLFTAAPSNGESQKERKGCNGSVTP